MAGRHDFIRAAHERVALMKIMNSRREGSGRAVPFVVDGSRGSQHVVTFFPATSHAVIRAMELAVRPFGCDLVAGTADTYQVLRKVSTADRSRVNPDTGEPWGAGGMGRAAARSCGYRGWGLLQVALLLGTAQVFERHLHPRLEVDPDI